MIFPFLKDHIWWCVGQVTILRTQSLPNPSFCELFDLSASVITQDFFPSTFLTPSRDTSIFAYETIAGSFFIFLLAGVMCLKFRFAFFFNGVVYGSNLVTVV
jgi:hypothetical protein